MIVCIKCSIFQLSQLVTSLKYALNRHLIGTKIKAINIALFYALVLMLLTKFVPNRTFLHKLSEHPGVILVGYNIICTFTIDMFVWFIVGTG